MPCSLFLVYGNVNWVKFKKIIIWSIKVQRNLFFVYTVVIVIIGLINVSAQNKPDIKGATIQFEEESHNFGKVSPDSIVYHVFDFKNTGDDTLKIFRVGSS